MGFTACHVACATPTCCALLLAHQPNLDTQVQKWTTLRLNIHHSHVERRISMMLIEAGAPLDGVDRFATCVVLAATSTSAIQTLLRRGVVVSELRDHQGRTPLHLADRVRRVSGSARHARQRVRCDLEARTTVGQYMHSHCLMHEECRCNSFLHRSWCQPRICEQSMAHAAAHGWATKSARFFCLPLVQMCTHATSLERTPCMERRRISRITLPLRAVDCECDARGRC
jgi:hypothetical protein